MVSLMAVPMMRAYPIMLQAGKERKTMPTLIQRALRGQADAMTELYQNNKKKVFYLCYTLLGSTAEADRAATHIFKSSWELLLAGEIENEADFSNTVMKKAVNFCKTKMLKSNQKAFRFPPNKNFAGIQYSPDRVVTDGDICEQILNNLPVLHRFIYICATLADWSEDEIAVLIHSNRETVRLALAAEETNISKILSCINQKTGEQNALSADEFHKLLKKTSSDVIITKAVDSVVIMGIDSIASPIAEKQKKKIRKISSIITGSVLLLILVVFGIARLVYSAEQQAEYDRGYDDGYDVGYSEGYEEGYDYGYDDGLIKEAETAWLTEIETPTHYAIIDIADYGQITVALDGNTAPQTVENFVTLVEEGFYDGLTFHRIIEGFMIQGGDPKADGTGGNTDESGNKINITGEFYANGYSNYLSHVRGAISMARANDYDSASSQFFIVHEDSSASLDTLYAAFGYVYVRNSWKSLKPHKNGI